MFACMRKLVLLTKLIFPFSKWFPYLQGLFLCNTFVNFLFYCCQRIEFHKSLVWVHILVTIS